MVRTRREFLTAILAAGASGVAAHAAKLRKIGLQLYTVRNALRADFEGTLRRVARLGYAEVEFAGVLGPDLKQTRKLLGQLGLSASSLHIDYDHLRNHTAASSETAHALGAQFVVCPWLDQAQRQSTDDWARVSANLNSIGEQVARSGLTLAYHNHDFEFASLPNGAKPFDLLLANTDERFVTFELDVYWARKGGVDPVACLSRHESRFRLVHLKDMARDGASTEIGNGMMDISAITKAAMDGGVRHFFVEQEDSLDPMRSIETSIAYLRKHP